MNKYFKEFLRRGLIFGGFGPIILGIIYAILDSTIENFALSGNQILIAILSVYLLAFVQAGASVFNQIESFSLPKSLFCHLGLLYAAYTICYLVNNWIPFDPKVILIFTAIFLAAYLTIWAIVYLSVKKASSKLNAKLQ
ncbi:MAG: DUF3021 domain-containing protein [Christensenellaceae bacterium]|nr:DUF3021 domain-containing protein [Christensenellaceae bacterium]